MRDHLRANLWLLGFTVVLCAVLYPLVLLGIGQTAFHNKAQGSPIEDEKGNVIGSRLIAQNFTGKEYFWPRPSAADYNGAASGASNWSASNPLLRDRVARQLGPIVCYDRGAEKYGKKEWALVGKDIDKWFWQTIQQGPEGLLGWCFQVCGVKVQSAFFELWRHHNSHLPLKPVPADMVMASGSGLDPHITLDNAHYQARSRIAAEWAGKITQDKDRQEVIRKRFEEAIFKLLDEYASSPLWGLAGVPLVNVLEVNLALRKRMESVADTLK